MHTRLPAPRWRTWLPTLATVLLLALASAALGVAIGRRCAPLPACSALSIPLAFYLFFLSGGISAIALLAGFVKIQIPKNSPEDVYAYTPAP